MPTRLASKVLVIGWDAADWRVIDPLLAAGALPNLKRLIDDGARANLASLEPKLSPILWTSIATGKTADKHGVLNFVEPDPASGGLRIVSSTTRRVKAIWNILTQAGLRTNVVHWYASHPAEPIRGVCVSNLFHEAAPSTPGAPWPPIKGAVHPESMSELIADIRLRPGEVRPEELLLLLPHLDRMSLSDPSVTAVARAVTQCGSVHNVATALLGESTPWDCTMVFYDMLDVLGHHFMQFHPPRMAHVSDRDFELFRGVVSGAYRLMDAMLGVLLGLAGPDATVVLLSDHGFYSDHLRPTVQASLDDQHAVMDATWHRHHGVLVMSGPGIKRAERVYGATLLDITPTVLTLLGVPVGADMDGRVLLEAFDRPVEVERVFSWDALAGETGAHSAEFNQDPFEAHDAMRQLADLGYVPDIAGEARDKIDLVKRETRFNLGLVYLTTRRPREALPILQEVHALKPDEGRYIVNLARCHFAIGNNGQAQELLEGFIAAHPDSADAKVLLASALCAEGKLEQAQTLLEQVQEQGTARLDVACVLGEAYILMGRYDEGEPLLRRVVAADPHSARARHALGLAALNRQRFEEAVSHCLDAVGLVHFYPDAHYTLGVAFTWMKDYEHAIRSFQVAVSMQPGLIDAHRYLATLYRKLGDGRNAPIHRDIAAQLMQERAQHGASPIDLSREPPMGPQEWARSMGFREDSKA